MGLVLKKKIGRGHLKLENAMWKVESQRNLASTVTYCEVRINGMEMPACWKAANRERPTAEQAAPFADMGHLLLYGGREPALV